MDFETRRDVGLDTTEMFYGIKSDQYAIKKQLIDMENGINRFGTIRVFKKCKRECIVHLFYASRGFVFGHKKIYLDEEASKIIKWKIIPFDETPIHDFACNTLYDYVFVKGYSILSSITEE